MTDAYSYQFDYETRMAELTDIAAMDRMAAELRPQSALSRWAQERSTQRSRRSRTRREARHARRRVGA